MTGVPYAVVLEMFIKRAKVVRHNVGEITVIWRENPRAEALGWKGRQTSGVHGMDVLPHEVIDEEVPCNWRGLSAFGLPSVLRNALRCGFGAKGLVDYDQENAHFEAAWDLVKEYELDEADFQALKNCTQDRGPWLLEIAKLAKCTRDEAKKMNLATGYLPSRSPGDPAPLHQIRNEMKRLFDIIAQREPERFAIAEAWHTQRPRVTLGSYAFMHRERLELDKMIVAAGSIMCPEADGLVVTNPSTETDAAIKHSSKRKIKVKPYPPEHG